MIGYLADKIGYRAHIMVVSTFCVFGFMAILIFYPCDVAGGEVCFAPVIIGYGLFAMSASLVGVYYGCLSLVVDPTILGTATGLVLSVGSGIGAL